MEIRAELSSRLGWATSNLRSTTSVDASMKMTSVSIVLTRSAPRTCRPSNLQNEQLRTRMTSSFPSPWSSAPRSDSARTVMGWAAVPLLIPELQSTESSPLPPANAEYVPFASTRVSPGRSTGSAREKVLQAACGEVPTLASSPSGAR